MEHINVLDHAVVAQHDLEQMYSIGNLHFRRVIGGDVCKNVINHAPFGQGACFLLQISF